MRIFRGGDIWEAVLVREVMIFRGGDIWEGRIFVGDDL